MNKQSLSALHISGRVYLSVFVFLVGSISLLASVPTYALSLDLNKTVNTALNNVPIINTLTLVPVPVVAVPVQRTTPTVAPSAQTTVTNDVQPDAAVTKSSVTANPLTETPIQSASVVAGSTSLPGLSLTNKQNQIAAASSHEVSQTVSYPSRVLSKKTAQVIFYAGLAGVFAGGYFLFIYRARMVKT